MPTSLLDIALVYHADDKAALKYANAIDSAFAYMPLDGSLSDFADVEDPWQRVEVLRCMSAAEVNQLSARPNVPSLYVLLISESSMRDPNFKAALDNIARSQPRGAPGNRNSLIYTLSENAIEQLPENLRAWQARDVGNLGNDRRIRPFNLALQAMHRARLVLATTASPTLPIDAIANDDLTLFLSHAKADGVFFARALREAISQVPGLQSFYDATDIDSGSNWADRLADAAARSVMIVLRTPAYEQRRACREEFETALLHGVPIVVVDAMSTETASRPSHLPFASMPTIRIADGNTYRVVSAALREHLRLLLMKAIAREKAMDIDPQRLIVWPRFPCVATITARPKDDRFLLIPASQVFDEELNASRELLSRINSHLKLEVLETFRPPRELANV